MGLLLVVSLHSYAQTIDAFARVSVSPREGVVRQPYRITISVYSSTWFARPLQFTNLRIDDAFIIPFTRTVSGINYINNKKYATLTFYYLVFPYSTGQLQIPELLINANIPPEGDYRGQDYTIRTKAQTIKIKELPSNPDEHVWMVAKNVRVTEKWSRSLNNLKVGDVIEREIVVSAEGTLPSLIQPFQIEKSTGTSIYPQQADLQDKRNSQDVNGERTERYSYLFEEEGEITIPEEVILWWNPQTKRVYKRTIQEQRINIAPNPNLAMMESLKDSLLALNTPVVSEVEDEGIPWREIGIFAVLVLLTLYFLRKAVVLLLRRSKEKRRIYVQSERYYFRQVQKALQKGTRFEIINSLYAWFDRTRDTDDNVAIMDYLTDENKKIFEQFITLDSNPDSKQLKEFETLIIKLRKKLLKPQGQKEKTYRINPV